MRNPCRAKPESLPDNHPSNLQHEPSVNPMRSHTLANNQRAGAAVAVRLNSSPWRPRAPLLLALLLSLPVLGQSRYVIVSERLAEVEQAAQGRGGAVQHRLKYLKGAVVDLPDQAAAAALRARFGARAIIEPDIVYSIDFQPAAPPPGKGKPGSGNPPPPPAQPPQTLPWGIAAVQAPAGWPFYSGAGVIVGVVDTGIQPDHPDLAANIVGGENFIVTGKVRGKAVVDPTKWGDDNGHGTHVAGTIAALDNGIGVVGVAPQAGLFAAKVLNSSGSGYVSAVADGILSCVANGAQVISLSLGGGDAEVLRLAVQSAASQGAILVAAAGNGGCACALYPSSYPEVLRISAVNSNLQLASFSSYGDIDYTAPGVGVLSTVIGSSYAAYNGTSMATPHVSGVVALMLSAGIDTLYAVDIGLPFEQQGNGLVSAVPVAP
ncbi:MAG: S8 family peptidase [Verrucomicrobia bacterium]|nr:S8 family peptidase [Verrucomicrobiota bacterium]